MALEPKSFLLNQMLFDYVLDHSNPISDVQRRLIDETAHLGGVAGMQIAPEQGTFMTLLTRALGVKTALEVGTFTGYSALAIAMGLSEEGRLLCCDVNDEWTAMARRYWELAGIGHRIDLRLGPALDTLRDLPLEPAFDLAFIDADKPNYVNYFEEVVPRLRSGGVLLVDNVLWNGEVVDPEAGSPDLEAIRAMNERIVGDDRVDSVLLPIGDGLTFALKR